MQRDGFGGSPVGHTDAGRPLDLLFVPATPEEVERAKRRGQRRPTAGHLLCCRGAGEPSAEVALLDDPLMERVRTGDPAFDLSVCVRTRTPLPWLMALDADGRRAIAAAVQLGWTCVGHDWVLPWSMDADLPAHLLPAVDAALDALSFGRTHGPERWRTTLSTPDVALRRAQLLLQGATQGWLTPKSARAMLQREPDPLVRLSLNVLFLPDTASEVAAGLSSSDPEMVGFAAVALAGTHPRGLLRTEVERALLRVMDTPLEGLFGALAQVGGPATLQALDHRVAAGGLWRGARRDRGFELLGALRAEALVAGAGPGAVSVAPSTGGELGLSEPFDDES